MNKADSFIGMEKETGNYEKNIAKTSKEHGNASSLKRNQWKLRKPPLGQKQRWRIVLPPATFETEEGKPLHVVIGTQEQLKNFKGPIDYGEYQDKYNKLYSYYKQIVDDIVYNLSDTKGATSPGYNYDQIIKWYRESNANQMTVAHAILTYNILGKTPRKPPRRPFERSAEDLEKTHGLETGITEDQHVIRFLDKFKKKIFPIEKRDAKSNDPSYYKQIVSLVCDYFLISEELIFEGKGEIYYAEAKHLDDICKNGKFRENVIEKFRAAPLKKYGGENNIFVSEYSTKAVLQEYAKYIGVDESEVIKTKYAAIYGKPDYYAFGAKNKTKYKQKAVNYLIDRLLLIQEHKPLFDILP